MPNPPQFRFIIEIIKIDHKLICPSQITTIMENNKKF